MKNLESLLFFVVDRSHTAKCEVFQQIENFDIHISAKGFFTVTRSFFGAVNRIIGIVFIIKKNFLQSCSGADSYQHAGTHLHKATTFSRSPTPTRRELQPPDLVY